MLYCPYFFWSGAEKCCTVPKKPKKPILQSLQAALKVLENRFFRFFIDSTALFNEKPKNNGQYSIFAIQYCPQIFVSRNQKFRDSTALFQSRGAKVLYSP